MIKNENIIKIRNREWQTLRGSGKSFDKNQPLLPVSPPVLLPPTGGFDTLVPVDFVNEVLRELT